MAGLPMATLSAEAAACIVPDVRYFIPLSPEQVAAATPPLMGFTGRVVGILHLEEGPVIGRRVVQIVVTADFTGQLPRTIYVRDSGPCGYRIRGDFGEVVREIVRVGDAGIYELE
jgi:hypothetical protein